MRKSAARLVEEANAEIVTVSVSSAQAMLGQNGIQFVDIRDVRELQKHGMIPGAMHAPRGMLEFWVDPECPYHREVFASGDKLILYCASAWRSALATKAVQDMGLENVCQLEGGFNAWIEAGGVTEELKR